MNKFLKTFATTIFSLSILLPTITSAAPDYSYKWVSQSDYLELYPEETARLWVLVENTGNATWDKNVPIHLGTSNPTDRTSDFYTASDWLSPNRSAWLTDDTTIRPGERAVFMFDITAPETPGVYKEYFRPVVEGISWLEDYGIFWQITVKDVEETSGTPYIPEENYQTDGIYRSELVYQESPNITLMQGESKSINIQIKNVGTATWHNTGNAPVRLGTNEPLDRSSNFHDSSWLAPNRVVNINESSVNPSEIANYQFTITAPANTAPGYYEEVFQSVAEGITWFQDFNITYKISVRSSDPSHGELLHNDSVDEFLDSGAIITITDVESGRAMQVKALGMDHWHSDVVPLTSNDTQFIRDIWNFHGDFNPYCSGSDWILWKPNAVTVQINSDPQGRTIAAAMHGCPHDIDGGITDNDFPGHFCLHFLESMNHGKSTPDCSMQKMVQKAGGNPNYSTYGQLERCWNPCVTGDC